VIASMLRLRWRSFAFPLPQPLVTARGVVSGKRGWLLRLEDGDGRLGWGEAAALEPGAMAQAIDAAIAGLSGHQPRAALEARLAPLPSPLPSPLPPPLAFALGQALAELEGLGSPQRGGWLAPPPSAQLLPAGAAALPALERLLSAGESAPASGSGPAAGPTVKWKVAALADGLERRLLEAILERLPARARLRLDANGGWDRATAWAWAERLRQEPRLQWLEQPLAPTDPAGLAALAALLPVALDESLRWDPRLRGRWTGWQVRRPALEGDPRPLLAALERGQPRWMVSTAFETGIGGRLLGHLAALQWRGPTPTAPGLAPGWGPSLPLLATDPALVWEAAG